MYCLHLFYHLNVTKLQSYNVAFLQGKCHSFHCKVWHFLAKTMALSCGECLKR